MPIPSYFLLEIPDASVRKIRINAGMNSVITSGANPSRHKQPCNCPHILLWPLLRLALAVILYGQQIYRVYVYSVLVPAQNRSVNPALVFPMRNTW